MVLEHLFKCKEKKTLYTIYKDSKIKKRYQFVKTKVFKFLLDEKYIIKEEIQLKKKKM